MTTLLEGGRAEDVLEDFKKKIADVVELQTEAEKTLMEHEKTFNVNDLSRYRVGICKPHMIL